MFLCAFQHALERILDNKAQAYATKFTHMTILAPEEGPSEPRMHFTCILQVW